LKVKRLDVPAERILAGKVAAGKGLAHDDRPRIVEPLTVVKGASSLERNLHCVEVPWVRTAHKGVLHSTRRGRWVLRDGKT
jgi:hypothetical protein